MGLLPAIRRYASPRIRAVYRESKRKAAGFAILSGRFGLLGPHQRIPYYDHLLRAGEVPALVPQMGDYLKRKGCRTVHFYYERARSFPQLEPYLKAIRLACRTVGVRLKLMELASAPPRL
jgi:hypothetical protein